MKRYPYWLNPKQWKAKNERLKNHFMPIPDAPGYAINERREVINRKTGRILKNYYRKSRNYYLVSVFNDGKEIKRSVDTFYRQALDAYVGAGVWWKQIPSLDYKYEIAVDGAVRNVLTKHILKPVFDRGCVYVVVQLNGEGTNRLIGELLAEVYPVSAYRRKNRPVAVQLVKENERRHFPTLAKCAEFLAPKFFYAFETIYKRLRAKPREIFGYSAKYF